MISRAFLTVALLLVSLFGACVVEAQQLPAGYPYITLTVTPVGETQFATDFFQTQISVWLRSNQAAQGYGSINPADITIGDMTPANSYPIELNFGISATRYAHLNAQMHEALTALSNGPISNIFGSNFQINSAVYNPNWPATTTISFGDFGRQYVNTWTGDMHVYLDFAPRPGKSISITLGNPAVTANPTTVTITYPARQGTFKLMSATAGTYGFAATRAFTTTDTDSNFVFSATDTTIQIDAPEQVEIIAPSATIVNYDMTATDLYTVRVPDTYRDATMRMIFTVRSSPAGLVVYSNNISITRRGVDYTFYAIGPVGTFTLSYVIAPPWNANSANNNYFASPTITHEITFVDSLGITVDPIPDAYMVNPPVTTDYGGAYSDLVSVTIENQPKRNLIIYISAPNCEVYPPQLGFSSAGATTQQFYARGLVTGLRTFTFTLGGQSAGDFIAPGQLTWRVHGPNPTCGTLNQINTCFGTNGCQWNEDRGLCLNRSLPINIQGIPVLFDGEESQQATITLASAVRSTLRILFIANSRLVFTPALIVMPAGAKSATFTVTGFLLPRDGVVRQSFYLRLSGADANYFQQTESVATIRPRIQCTIEKPDPFYVGTESFAFNVVCDDSPEVGVTLLPQASPAGIVFEPISESDANGALVFNSTTTTASFFAKSDGGIVTTFTITMVIGGPNAARYEDVPPITIRTLPLATLNPLPNFHFTMYERTPQMHIDLSILPPNPIYVSMTVLDENGVEAYDNITLTPPTLTFNESQRNFVDVTGIHAGTYTIVYTIVGINSRNYEAPSNSTFECLPALDGNAFTYRLQQGFQPKTACRINVGKNAQSFKGQDAVDVPELFCGNVKVLFANVSNGTSICPTQPTEERCRAALQYDGTVCVWFKGQCQYLPELQGTLKDIAYGSGYTLLLARNGSVYSIGKVAYGQLGHFNEDGLDRVILPENISTITAGVASSFALSVSGRVYAWGANGNGQLGINKNIQQTEKIYEITFPRYENISCISSGAMHAGAISLSGKVYMWGSNEFGQTAYRGSYRSFQRYPIVLNTDYFDGDPVRSFQCGEYHTMVATDNAAYTFGNNNRGQLGRPGFDEWMPGQPILWSQSRFVEEPTYASYIRGYGC